LGFGAVSPKRPRGIESTDRGRTFLYESERVMGDFAQPVGIPPGGLRGALSDTLMIGMGSGMAQDLHSTHVRRSQNRSFQACGLKS